MNKTTWVLLIVSVVLLGVGLWLNAGAYHFKNAFSAGLYAVLPVSPVVFGLFMTVLAFGPAAETFDKQEADKAKHGKK
jgi:hypothetical protein